MNTVRQTYSHNNIEMLRDSLFEKVQNGKAIKFSVMVDSIPAVSNSDDINRFDDYLKYLRSDTKEVMFRIYPHPNSFNCSKYIFELASSKSDKPELSIKEIVAQQVERERHIMKIESLSEKLEDAKNQVSELKSELDDKNDQILKLQDGLEKQQNESPKTGDSLGHIAGVALEGIIKRNPALLKAIPGGEGLAGAFTPQESNSSNEKETPVEYEEQQDSFLVQLRQVFSEDEYNTLFRLIDLFAKDKPLLSEASELFLNQ